MAPAGLFVTKWRETMPMKLNPSHRIAFVRQMQNLIAVGRWGCGVISLEANNPVRMDREKPMYKWLAQGGDVPTVCNCWEAIVIAGFNAGLWGLPYVRAALERVRVDEDSKVPQLTQFMQSRIAKNTSAGERHGGDWAGFIGNIVMIGYSGEHFALAAGYGKLLELDKPSAGLVTLADILERYRAHTSAIYVSDPPTLEELGNPPLQRGRAT